MIKEDVGSSQDESVILAAAAGGREVSPNPLDVSAEKLKRSEKGARLANPESIRNAIVYVAAKLVVEYSLPCGDASKDGEGLPIAGERAAIDVAEAGIIWMWA